MATNGSGSSSTGGNFKRTNTVDAATIKDNRFTGRPATASVTPSKGK